MQSDPPATSSDLRFGSQDATTRIADRVFARIVALVALALGTLTYLAQVRGSQFFADDFLYLQLARDGSWTPAWLAENSYGHFAPANRLAYLAVQRGVGLDYPAAALLPTALVVTIFLTVTWLFRELAGGRFWPVALGLLGATSVPVLRTMMWFGSANHVLGAAATMTLCVTAFVVYSRHEQEKYRVVSVLALTCGLLIQERPMITIGYLVLIRYLLQVRPPLPRDRRDMIRGEALFWYPWVTVEALYVVYRMFIFTGAPEPGNAHDAVEFVGLSVFRGWAPSLVGVRVLPDTGLVTPATIVGLLAFTGISVLLVVRRQQAWRALVFFAAIYLANMGIVAVGRLNVADMHVVAADLQYYVDVHLGTILAFGFGFTVLPARTDGGARRQPSRRFRPLLVIGAAGLALSTAITGRAIVHHNLASDAHDYVARVQRQLEARPAPYALLRTKLPLTVAPSFIDPWTDVPEVFALDDDIAERMDPTADQRLVVTETGRVVTAHPTTLTSVQLTPQTATARVGTFSDDQQAACLSGPAGSNVQVPLDGNVASRGLFFSLTYTSDHPSEVRPVALRGEETAFNQNLTELPPGKSVTVVDRLDGRTADSIVLGFDGPVSGLCLQHLWIGRISADVASGCRVLTEYGEPTQRSDDCSEEWPVD